MKRKSVLSVRDLRTYFYNDSKKVIAKAVDGVNIDVFEGSVTAIVGESGSGKSITALSVLGLIKPPGEVISGEIILNGRDVKRFKKNEMQQIRGKEISMIFQDSASALNPVLKIERQLIETILIHEKISLKNARERSIELLRKVGLSNAEKVMKSYPFQLSGGMCQRVMIAISMVANPSVMIADEPTTALDLTIQAQILEELNKLKDEKGTAILIITHDLGVVSEIADYVYVMKLGKIVEEGTVYDIFDNPRNEYTKKLLDSIF